MVDSSSDLYLYPYPSNVCVANFVTVKLIGRDTYKMWKTQMLCLLKSHEMFGFIDGTHLNPTNRPESSIDSRKEQVGDYLLWERSDALVKGWILGSLSQQAFRIVLDRLHQDFSAKNAWDEIQNRYAPVVLREERKEDIITTQVDSITGDAEAKEREEHKKRMNDIHLKLHEAILRESLEELNDILKNKEVSITCKISINGNTALHIAVGIGKEKGFIEKMLEMVPENTLMASLKNSDGSTLLHVAATVGNTDAAKILVAKEPNLLLAKDRESRTPLERALSNMHTDTYLYLYGHIKKDIEEGTMFAGTSGDELLVNLISAKDFKAAVDLLSHYHTINSDAALMAITQNYPSGVMDWQERLCSYALNDDEWFMSNLYIVIGLYDSHHFWQIPMICFLFVIFVVSFPLHKLVMFTAKLKGRLAPSNKLNLISGAALQIQRELQWFKEVETFVCPLNKIQKNSHGETPQMVFTREHKELVIEGEKWMKATAESYTITAALITTIVFAAAITVPGGSNQDTGIPVFTNDIAFTIFAISDAISLFTSTTSLLMFLSILTARFAEHDFLFKLPLKLIIGLATLFISTTAMIVAFGATLFLVFGQRKPWIIGPIVALTCLPIASFVTLQFPLIGDLVSATFGRSIFGKKRDDPFY